MEDKKKVCIKLDKAVSYMIHGPHIKLSEEQQKINKEQGFDDNFPLYARGDQKGYDKRSEIWRGQVEKIYNSPRNVRALYISMNEVTVWYWTKGDLGNGQTVLRDNPRTVRYDSVPESVSGVAPSELAGLLRYIMRYYFGDNQALQFLNENNIDCTRGMFDVFDKDWALTNLEELYFDSTMLVGVDIKSMRKLCSLNHNMCKVYKKGGKRYYMPSKHWLLNSEITEIPEDISEDYRLYHNLYKLTKAGLSNNTEMNKPGIPGYPRLKVIGFICNRPFEETAQISLANENAIRLRYIGIGDTLDFADKEMLFAYNQCGMVDKIIKKHLHPQRVAGIFINTGINLYKAGFSTFKDWVFDEKFLMKYFENLEKALIAVQYHKITRKTYGNTQADSKNRSNTKEEGAHIDVVEQSGIKTKTSKKEELINYFEGLKNRIEEGATNECERTYNETIKENRFFLVLVSMRVVLNIMGKTTFDKFLDGFSLKGKELYKDLADRCILDDKKFERMKRFCIGDEIGL